MQYADYLFTQLKLFTQIKEYMYKCTLLAAMKFCMLVNMVRKNQRGKNGFLSSNPLSSLDQAHQCSLAPKCYDIATCAQSAQFTVGE